MGNGEWGMGNGEWGLKFIHPPEHRDGFFARAQHEVIKPAMRLFVLPRRAIGHPRLQAI